MVIRAGELEKRLGSGEKLNFEEIIYCNIGNPQQLGQKPITFYRQVLSLMEYPDMLEDRDLVSKFPSDVVERAKELLQGTPGGMGAYSHSQGIPLVRKQVAEFIGRRDGHAADAESIFLTDGASPGVQTLLKLMLRDEKDGVMIPIPQYPLYSAGIPLFGGSQVNYFLDEEEGWGLNVQELQRSYEKAIKGGVTPRGLVVINPGNPTGQVLDVPNMKDIVKFCEEKNVVLLADEVYQENIYSEAKKPFTSFKKVVCDMGAKVQLVSFHSISKGVTGECGKRGGYYELLNFDKPVVEQIYKLASISLCPNVPGQILLSMMINPPKPSGPSYKRYKEETEGIYESLRRRAKKVADTFSKLDGISCNPAEGAMYAFPKISLPEKAVNAAKEAKKSPDLFYTINLLENTGVCVVPGSGFGQKEGTFHFRTTILPLEHKLDAVLHKFEKFHNHFLKQYK